MATEDGFIVNTSLELKNAAAKGIGASDDLIYVLKSNNEIDEISASELVVSRTHKLAYDATALNYSTVSKEIWVGDKKGLLHVHSSTDFSQVH